MLEPLNLREVIGAAVWQMTDRSRQTINPEQAGIIADALSGEGKSKVAVAEYMGEAGQVTTYALGRLEISQLDNAAHAYPRVVQMFMPTERSMLAEDKLRREFPNAMATTRMVVDFFRSRCRHGFPEEALHPNIAPASKDSRAIEPMGGDVPYVSDIDAYGAHWYDLSLLLFGQSVYRISRNHTLWIFTREDANDWRVRCAVGVDAWAQTFAGPLNTLLFGAVMMHEIYWRRIKNAA